MIGNLNLSPAGLHTDPTLVAVFDTVLFQGENRPRDFIIIIHNRIIIQLKDARDINTLRARHAAAAGCTFNRPELAISIPDSTYHNLLWNTETIRFGAISEGNILL